MECKLLEYILVTAVIVLVTVMICNLLELDGEIITIIAIIIVACSFILYVGVFSDCKKSDTIDCSKDNIVIERDEENQIKGTLIYKEETKEGILEMTIKNEDSIEVYEVNKETYDKFKVGDNVKISEKSLKGK